MFACVTLTASELAASRRFYETVLAALARDPWSGFALEEGSPSTRGLHVAFAAQSRDEVDAFWRAGVGAGYPSDGEPGLRPQYRSDYYGGFLLDPDGNSVEAVHRPRRTESGPVIDHLWLGVTDLAASRRFYESISPSFGLEVEDASRPGHVSVFRDGRHLMLVADGRPPTERVRIEVAAESSVPSATDPHGNVVAAP